MTAWGMGRAIERFARIRASERAKDAPTALAGTSSCGFPRTFAVRMPPQITQIQRCVWRSLSLRPSCGSGLATCRPNRPQAPAAPCRTSTPRSRRRSRAGGWGWRVRTPTMSFTAALALLGWQTRSTPGLRRRTKGTSRRRNARPSPRRATCSTCPRSRTRRTRCWRAPSLTGLQTGRTSTTRADRGACSRRRALTPSRWGTRRPTCRRARTRT
jgi:hypothetical protein